MDRQQIIAKIQAMLKLQNQTSFEGEASAAAHLIDKLCKQHGITIKEATEVQILDEEFLTFKRINVAHSVILNAVSFFYDAKAYIYNSVDVKSLKVIGSEAQQIQVRLYYEYLIDVMEKECTKAYNAEKILSELTGSSVNRGFKTQFRKAFADQVQTRLKELKIQENRVHDDANAVKDKLSTMRMGKAKKFNSATGSGAFAGSSVGSSVSLNRQATGKSQRALMGV